MKDCGLGYQLNSIIDMIRNINDEEYSRSSAMLGGSSIGQHVRHVIESVQAIINGYAGGVIDYDHRQRNQRIAGDRRFAILKLEEGIDFLLKPDKVISLNEQTTAGAIVSTYNRELLYNTDHAIHHMALMRVALREFSLDVVDDNFGKAPSTIAFELSSVR